MQHRLLSKNLKFFIALLLPVAVIIVFSCKKDPFICMNGLMREPYLQMAGSDQIIIKWRTCYATESLVRYGISPGNLKDSALIEEGKTDHEVHLTNLQPGTKYYYSVGTRNEILQGNIDNYFVTHPKEGDSKSTRIWVTGDAGSGDLLQRRVRDSYIRYAAGKPADMWLWLGDNAYEDGTDDEYQKAVFTNSYEKLMKNICVWPAIGNHDFANVGYNSAQAVSGHFPYYDIFALPENGESGGLPSGTEKYYSFNYGDIHIICLDSYSSANHLGSSMHNWLQQDLSRNTSKWTIVFMHHPPYTMGSHNSDKEKESIDVRNNILPILEKYSVDLVLTGHSHSYERSYMLNGHYGNSTELSNDHIMGRHDGRMHQPYVKSKESKGTVYAVVGVSGRLGGKKSDWPHPAMAYASVNKGGSMVIDIDGNQLHAKFIGTSANVLDEFAIIKK
ncbi:MAG: metallophosphoesterase [Cytophagaceae bacterium]